jgi:hypothetical protein
MPGKTLQYEFKIDAFTPETLPMARLAEYMSDLAEMLGNTEHVHFVKLRKSSTVIVHAVEWEAAPKIQERVEAIKQGEAPQEALKAFRAIDNRLASDNATGLLIAPAGRKVIDFPGRSRQKVATYSPISQSGTLDGILIRVGGEGDQVPVHLVEGDTTHICHATREVAKGIAHHLYGAPLRVTGNGKWRRDEDGLWKMDRFIIAEFKALKNETLNDAVGRVRAAAGPVQDEDQIVKLREIRSGSDKVH